jgi:hypothetical protein
MTVLVLMDATVVLIRKVTHQIMDYKILSHGSLLKEMRDFRQVYFGRKPFKLTIHVL